MITILRRTADYNDRCNDKNKTIKITIMYKYNYNDNDNYISLQNS